jgi:2,3-bisphosphoglycerate-dependent phosphoglycerate mutase
VELYLIRHGQSTNNAAAENPQTRVYDPPLTDLGRRQADNLAGYLRGAGITHLYCSPMYRALQTTAPAAAALGMKAEIWVDVHEHGGMYLEEAGAITGYPGRNRAQIADEFPAYIIPDAITDAGWWDMRQGQESLSACYGRAIKIAAELRRRAADRHDQRERIALITHGTFIDALIKALLNQLPALHLYYLHNNTAITRIDFDHERVLVRGINRVDHMPPDLIS